MISLGSVFVGFSNRMVLGRVGLSVGRGRFMAVLNPSNYNGAAALHVVNNFIRPSDNSIVFNNGEVGKAPPGGEGMGAMFRGCSLFPRLGIFSGITFKLGLGGVPGSRVGGHMASVLTAISLGNCRGHSITGLSNNRRRHITVTETLIYSPRVVLLSRPLNTLSLGLHGDVRLRLGRVRRGARGAFVCIARSRRRTLAVDSHIIIVGGNMVRRVNSPRSVCGRPIGTFITSFVNRTGVLGKVVLSSYEVRVLNGRLRYISGKFNEGAPISIIVHPRSVRIASPRSNRLIKAIRGAAFGNIRCRVDMEYKGYRVLVRSARSTRVKDGVNVEIVPFGVRVVGGLLPFCSGIVRAAIACSGRGSGSFRFRLRNRAIAIPSGCCRRNAGLGVALPPSTLSLTNSNINSLGSLCVRSMICGNRRGRVVLRSSREG